MSGIAVGAGTLVYVNGKMWGRAVSFSFSPQTPHVALRGLDFLGACELSPTGTSISGRLSMYRKAGDGGVEGAGMSVASQYIPTLKYFSLSLVDRRTKTVLFEAPHCVVDNQTWTVQPKSIITGEIAFQGLDWNNELQPVRT
jgi:hypothetical protein